MPRKKRMKSKRKLSFRPTTSLERARLSVALTLLAVTLFGLGESVFWLGLVAREWSLLLSCLVAFVLSTSLWARAWLASAACTLGLVVCLWPLAALWRPHRPVPSGGPALRLGLVNAAGQQPRGSDLSRLILDERLDALALLDLPAHKLSAVAQSSGFTRAYQRTEGGREDALYAAPPRLTKRLPRGARLAIGRCTIELTLVALPSVLSPGQRAARAAQIAQLEVRDRRSVMLGDLGGRPQAADLAPRLAALGLRDSRVGFGALATAPGSLGPLGRAVDHLLTHGWISVHERRAATALGPGQHRVTLATLELTEPRCRDQP